MNDLTRFANFTPNMAMTADTPMTADMVLIYRYVFSSGLNKIGWVRPQNCIGKTPNEAFSIRYSSGKSGREIKCALKHYDPSFLIFDIKSVLTASKLRENVYDLNTTLDKALASYLIEQEIGIAKGPKTSNEEGLLGIEENYEAFIEHCGIWGGVRPMPALKNWTARPTQDSHIIAPCVDLVDQGRRHIIVSAYTGCGKTTLSPSLLAKISQPGRVCLFTTAIANTLPDLIKNIRNNWYGQKMVVFNKDAILNADFNERLNFLSQQGYICVLAITVQSLRRRDGDVAEDSFELAEKYVHAIGDLPIDVWIRDEAHTQYNGYITSRVLNPLVDRVRLLIDTTATPFNLFDHPCYMGASVIPFSWFDAKKLQKAGAPDLVDLPDVKIEVHNLPPTSDTSFKNLYTDEEGFDARKQFDVKDGEFVYVNALLDIQREVFKPNVDNKKKHPYSIYAGLPRSEKPRIGFLVVPMGDSECGCGERGEMLAALYNEHTNSDFFVTATQIQNEVCYPNTVNDVVMRLREEHKKNIVIITHRQMTTGTNIPEASFIVLLDKVSSIMVFMQLIGRISRVSKGKKFARVLCLQPGMTLAVTAYEALLANANNHHLSITKEDVDCLPLTYYAEDGKVRVVTLEEMFREFNAYMNRIIEGTEFSVNWVGRFNLEKVVIDLNPIITAMATGSSSKTKVTDPTDAKAKTIIRTVHDLKEKGEKIKGVSGWKETIALMLNECFYIGIVSECQTLIEVYSTTLAIKTLGLNNCQFLQALLKLDNDFSKICSSKYQEEMESLRSLPIEVINERFFTNRPYKKNAGLVYPPKELANQILNSVKR